MDLTRVMKNIGFSDESAKTYISLLELGDGNIQSLQKKTKLSKEKVSNCLQWLMENKIVDTFTTNNIFYFKAISPEKLIREHEIKLEKVKMILPELLALDNHHGTKPKIKFYEGREGLISIMEDSLTAQDDILNWNDISIATDALNDYYPVYIKKKNTFNIFVRALLNDDPLAKDFQASGMSEKREVRIIPKEKFPFKNEINIYNNKVSIISHNELVGVIIESDDIAETQRSIFKLAWEYAEILQNKNS